MNIRELFGKDGYLTNLGIMSPSEMAVYGREFDRIQGSVGKKASQVGLMNLHKENPLIWEMVRHSKVLAAMSEVLGTNLLLIGSHFFCKYPDLSESFVAWHQDVTYWGLNPPKAATLWLAIDDTDVENGCMRVIPGSHRSGILPHAKAVRAGNLLSVNQEIPVGCFDESTAVDLPLQAGAASIHDGVLIHGSNPNRSARRRCGLTMRFTTPDVAPIREDTNVVKWKPILIQGEDRHGHFDLDPAPSFAVPTSRVD